MAAAVSARFSILASVPFERQPLQYNRSRMQFVLIILVAVHLLAVNLAGGGPLVAIWLEWRAKCAVDSASWIAAAKTLAVWSLLGAIVGVSLGLIALVM